MKNSKENTISKTVKTEQEWQEFLSHRLSIEKETEFINKSEENEFHKDAFEGISSIPNRAQVLSVVNQMNNKIRLRVGGKSTDSMLGFTNFKYFRIISIAAVVVILISITYIFNFISNKFGSADIAKNEVVNAAAIETLEPLVNSDASISNYEDTAHFEDPSSKNAAKESESNKAYLKEKPNLKPLTSSEKIIQNEGSAQEAKINAFATKVESPITDIAKDQSSEKSKINATITENSAPTIVPSSSKQMMNESISSPKESTDALVSTTQDESDIKWVKAISYLNNKDKKKAIILFKELLNDNTKYKERAKAELEKIK